MEYSQLLNFSTVWIADNVTRILTACLILFVGFWFAGLMSRQIRNLLPRTRRVDNTLAPLLSQIVRYGIIVVTVVISLSQFGIQTTSILAVLGAAGLAIALALQGTLSNIASGVMLIWLRPFRVGEYVDAEGTAGTIIEVGLFATELKTYDGIFIFVPNSRLWDARITNYSRQATRMVETKISIAYDSSLPKAREVLMDVAKDPRVLSEPAPMVFVAALGASSVDLVMRTWVMSPDWWRTNVDFHERAKLAFDAAGIEIPYGKLDINIRNGQIQMPQA
jgi:small conductance mechanosensitive channel